MNVFARTLLAVHVGLYRLTSGRMGGKMFGGDVLLLTTVGSKSGRKRTVPVMYFENGGRRYVVGSYGGSPTHPAWFKNLQRQPRVEVQVLGRRYMATGEVIGGDERARVWGQVIHAMPQFANYEARIGKGGREIPIVYLRES